MNDDRDPFKRTVDQLFSMSEGRRYKNFDYRKKLLEYWIGWYGLELDTTSIEHRPLAVKAVVTSLTIDISTLTLSMTVAQL